MSLPTSSQLKNIMEKEKKHSHCYSGGEKLSPAANLLCPVLFLLSNPDQTNFLAIFSFLGIEVLQCRLGFH